MNRLWSRVGVRVTAVGLLVAGATGGVYLGQDQDQPRSAEASVVAQVAADETQLLKQRQSEHAAARAFQRQAEGNAAEKAATAAKAAAGKARQAEQKVIAQKKAAAEAAAKKKAEEEAAAKESGGDSGSTPEFDGDIPASCNEFSGNRAIGCTLMLKAGFEISQFSCLEKLWKKESGWNEKAENKSSGAYGIPQALPGSKMKSSGSDWKTNPATQIDWGLGYIEGRYNTPCAAWGHSQDVGWY
ncbi:lytic transglycosylase domain-containing protein [Actinoplanes sp. LDG1-06]|uniref:Lytic transglycosylase domain-containing protein n=1 Tax=Paractinoplanes ovalisporus TaxID=2810368 RepID=A0ABS2AS29_9ACTN|nr:lytic transglycosylase domain-containing protein [Actinoplanes ovalisporus]MBM2622570.1 lytic transglycosylase domain-containing protein [Actinoplanes ovalisporus]